MTTPTPATGQETSQPAAAGGAASAGSSSTTVLTDSTQQTSQQQQQNQNNAQPSGESAKPGEAQQQQQGAKPEKYGDFRLPEGMQADSGAISAVSPVLLKHGLTQEAAQELVDAYAGHVQKANTEFEQQLANEEFAVTHAGQVLEQQREKWAAALKSDKEIGGTNYDANVKVAQRAIARFASPALKQLLNATGLGNHPEFVRFALKVGRGISEDSPGVSGGAQGRKSAEDVFYGGQG